MRIAPAFVAFSLIAAVASAPAWADDPSFTLIIKNHKYSPETLEVPANVKIKLIVQNQDPTPEEFESSSLHREKVVPGGKEITVNIGPLKPGSYEFIGDFNRATAHGNIVAK